MSDPAVSVVLPCWHSDATLAACLESLRAQTFRDFEVVVVDSSPDDACARIVEAGFLEVRLHRSERRLWPHAARNLGATLARGRILVFTDPDCRMSPRWLDILVRAQRTGRHVVGGAVGCLHGGYVAQGVHLCKYPWWLPGGRPGTRPELPSANVSYSREVFVEAGGFPEEWCGDTLLSQRARACGSELWFEPDAVLHHDHEPTPWSFLRERFERGYDFGLARPRHAGWSRPRTAFHVLASPAAWLVMLARSFRFAAMSGHLGALMWHLPVVAAGFAARQCGEACGLGRSLWRRS